MTGLYKKEPGVIIVPRVNIFLFIRVAYAVLIIFIFQQLSACTSYGDIHNRSINKEQSVARYDVGRAIHSSRSNQITFLLAFSGGGTRAAALSYGVLEALRDTRIKLNGRSHRLLDEIDAISSVSGGSFTAAYFGLNGDRIFKDYEKDFLRRDVTGELLNGLLSPTLWFSRQGRTEMAVNYYEDKVFKGATYADLVDRNGPLIVVNATDLGRGVRFSFLQSYFDLLCSDLNTYPVARAVTASSAVPVLFHPVVLENHSGCHTRSQTFLKGITALNADSPQLSRVVEGLSSYANKEQRQFIHMVDGGISDNLGLLAIYEMVEISGGAKKFLDMLGGKPAPKFVVISVNASTEPQNKLESTNQMPSMETAISLMTDVQLHRTNAATLELMQNSIKRWADEVSTSKQAVESYFVEIDFKSIAQAKRRLFFNQIPTSFSLTEEQVNDLIEVGRELLLNNKEFQRFITELDHSSP